jgi:hypothetical protein
MSDALAITALEQRERIVIERRLEQVEPIVNAIYRATKHLPAVDRLAVAQRLEETGRAQRGTWNVSPPLPSF